MLQPCDTFRNVGPEGGERLSWNQFSLELAVDDGGTGGQRGPVNFIVGGGCAKKLFSRCWARKSTNSGNGAIFGQGPERKKKNKGAQASWGETNVSDRPAMHNAPPHIPSPFEVPSCSFFLSFFLTLFFLSFSLTRFPSSHVGKPSTISTRWPISKNGVARVKTAIVLVPRRESLFHQLSRTATAIAAAAAAYNQCGRPKEPLDAPPGVK